MYTHRDFILDVEGIQKREEEEEEAADVGGHNEVGSLPTLVLQSPDNIPNYKPLSLELLTILTLKARAMLVHTAMPSLELGTEIRSNKLIPEGRCGTSHMIVMRPTSHSVITRFT